MLAAAPRPPRQSFLDGPSTVFCVAVVACTVVIKPCRGRPRACSARVCAALKPDTDIRQCSFSAGFSRWHGMCAHLENAELLVHDLQKDRAQLRSVASQSQWPLDSATPHGTQMQGGMGLALASGARQLVVQDALDTILSFES